MMMTTMTMWDRDHDHGWDDDRDRDHKRGNHTAVAIGADACERLRDSVHSEDLSASWSQTSPSSSARAIVPSSSRPASTPARQRYPHFDILVVDNGSAEPVHDICRSRGAACISEPVAGLTRARNLGARAARGDIVAYIDDDAIAEPEWLAALAREFDDPEVAAVAGRTRYMKAQGDSLRMSDEEAPGEIGRRPHQRFDRRTRDWFTLACFGRHR